MRKCQKSPPSSSCQPEMATTTTTTTIDDLPEGILTHIISFLPVIDAINTAPVSSKWRRLWLSTPILRLCISDYAHRFDDFASRSEIRQRFVVFANEIIILRFQNSSPLHEFELSFDYQNHHHKKFVEFWIFYAIAFKCKVLLLSLSNSSEYGYGLPSAAEDEEDDEFNYCIYPFKFSSMVNFSVEELKLHGCKFRSPSAIITSLKSLHLVNYEFEMDDSKLTELLPKCVNLELLTIEGNGGWYNLYISSTSLKEVNLSLLYGPSPRGGENSVEIHAPNLRSVSFDQAYVGKCIIQDANSLVEASVLFPLKDGKTFYCWSHLIASLTDVERLTVENMWYLYKFDQLDEPEETTSHDEPDTDSDYESIKYSGKVSLSKKIFSEDFAFNNLKYLKLLTGYDKRDVLGLGLCLEMCPKLETLVLVNVYAVDADDDLIEMSESNPIIMEIPKLRQVSLLKYKGWRNEVHVVGLLKKHKVVLENITAFPAEEKKKPIILWTSSSVYRNATRSSKAIIMG